MSSGVLTQCPRWWCLAACIIACSGLAQAMGAEADTGTQQDDLKATTDTESVQGYGVSPEYLRLRLLDPEGRPVAGAKAGPTPQTRQDMLGGIVRWREAATSDQEGKLVLSMRRILLPGRTPGRQGIYILHEGRMLGALRPVTKADAGKILDIHLSPMCRVHGTLASGQLEAAGMPLLGTAAEVYSRVGLTLEDGSRDNSFEFLLPPGEYAFVLQGRGGHADGDGAVPFVTASARQEIRSQKIAEGQDELDLGIIELPPIGPSKLIGRPAPDLGPVKAWTNGSPVTLAELRGRAVILHFGGPSPRGWELDRLRELHGAFYTKGLTILAIYNSTTMEELERHYPIRDVRFRIAIDGGEPEFSEGAADTPHERYDVTREGATVLIDPAGNVAGTLRLDCSIGTIQEAAKATLHKMLGIQEPPLPPPAWTSRFDEIYRLEDGEVLKRIVPQLIPKGRSFMITESPLGADYVKLEYLGFRWDGRQEALRAVFAAPQDLGSLLEQVIGLKVGDYRGPRELLDLKLPGDWIVRMDTPEERTLHALEQLLAEETKREIKFEKRTAVRNEIVATGRFKFHPVYEDGRICVFSGDSWATDDAGLSRLGRVDSTRQFLQAIEALLRAPIVDNTEVLTDTSIPFCADVDRVLQSDEGSEEWRRNLESLLTNLSAQTELQFKIDARHAEIWFVTERASN